MKLRVIAEALGCELVGDGEVEISGVLGMEHAGPGQLTFLANPKYAPKVKHTKAAVVVGGDGFGFAKRADGTHFKIVQSGVTVIEDDVEVQSLTSVDRATVGETRVKRGAKIDSLVQIGHACTVGEDNIICAQTGLAGSTVLERNVLLAGQVGSAGHLTVHEGAVVYAQSGIGGDVEKGGRISGSPAFAAGDWLRAVTAFAKLPEMLRSIRELKKKVEQLEQNVK